MHPCSLPHVHSHQTVVQPKCPLTDETMTNAPGRRSLAHHSVRERQGILTQLQDC